MADLVPYTGTALARTEMWANWEADERKRRAVLAAQHKDVEALCSLLEAHLTLRGRKGAKVSPHTIRAYRAGVAALVADWSKRNVNMLHATSDHAALWLRYLEDAGLKPSTVTSRLAAARWLYAALRWANACTVDPFPKEIKPAPDPVAPWDKRQPYSDDDVDRLLAIANTHDRVLILLGAHAGLRVFEALALQWSDVDLDARKLRVRCGKGGKPGTIDITRSLAMALQALHENATDCNDSPPIATYNEFVIRFRATCRARRTMERLCTRAGITYRGYHALRHHCGTRLQAQVENLELVQHHLRHSNISTTQSYAKFADRRLQRATADW